MSAARSSGKLTLRQGREGCAPAASLDGTMLQHSSKTGKLDVPAAGAERQAGFAFTADCSTAVVCSTEGPPSHSREQPASLAADWGACRM